MKCGQLHPEPDRSDNRHCRLFRWHTVTAIRGSRSWRRRRSCYSVPSAQVCTVDCENMTGGLHGDRVRSSGRQATGGTALADGEGRATSPRGPREGGTALRLSYTHRSTSFWERLCCQVPSIPGLWAARRPLHRSDDDLGFRAPQQGRYMAPILSIEGTYRP